MVDPITIPLVKTSPVDPETLPTIARALADHRMLPKWKRDALEEEWNA